MKSIKIKILLPLFLMIIFFLGFMIIQFTYANNNLKLVKEMNTKYFATISKTDKLKLDVVEVQQWLTDISATRAAKGFDRAPHRRRAAFPCKRRHGHHGAPNSNNSIPSSGRACASWPPSGPRTPGRSPPKPWS